MAKYQVGYGKPPRESQFVPGVSGNLKGRPQGSLNVATTVQRVLRETIVVKEGDQRKRITKLEAAVKQLAHQALSGNIRAVHLVLNLASAAEQRSEQEQPVERPLGQAEARMLSSLVKQYGSGEQKNPRDA